jgi:tetratricopeptide (TPR) repeat protein
MTEEPMARLASARRLASERRWIELAGLSCELSVEAVEAVPELGYLVADALRRTGEIEQSTPLARVAARAALTYGEPRLRLRTVNLLGMIEYESGKLAEAEDFFEKLLQDAADDHDDEFAARASNNLGVIAGTRGDYELALTAYQRALASYQRLSYSRGLAQTHHNIGIAYRDLGFPEKAEGNFSLAVSYAAQAGSDDVTALAETERALLRAAEGDGALADKLAQRALDTMRGQGDPLGAANALRAKAAAANVLGGPALAHLYLDEAMGIIEHSPDLLLHAEIQRDKGRLFLKAGVTSEGIAALKAAIDSFQKLGASREVEATRRLLQDTSYR